MGARWYLSRPLGLAALVAALLPAGFLALFYAYVLRARLEAGHWPVLYHPESWSLFPRHYALLRPWFYDFDVSLLPLVTWAVLFIVWAWLREPPRLAMRVAIASSTVLWLVVGLDPGHFINWFLD